MLALWFLSHSAFCANLKLQGQKARSVLFEKPYFTLKIISKSCIFNVYLNDIDVFSHDRVSHLNLEIPINHWMHPKHNDLRLEYATDKDWPLSSKRDCHIALQVRPNKEDEHNNLILGSIHYLSQTLALNGPRLIVTPPGRYNSTRQLHKEDKGDVVIKKAMITGEHPDYFSRAVTLPMEIPNSLPLWAFYGSDEIPVIGQMTEEQFYKFETGFLKIYLDIIQGVVSGNIDAILPLFAERNKETDQAFYFESGHAAKKLKQVFMDAHEKIKKNEEKPSSVEAKNLQFDYRGKYLVRLQGNHGTPVIWINYPKLRMSESFDIIFRRKNGQWIISQFTRMIGDI